MKSGMKENLQNLSEVNTIQHKHGLWVRTKKIETLGIMTVGHNRRE